MIRRLKEFWRDNIPALKNQIVKKNSKEIVNEAGSSVSKRKV